MSTSLTEFDARLLSLVQAELPLVAHPFACVADALGADEAQVIDRLAELKRPPKPVIRQISAIFDSKALGYQSTLVAARVDEAQLDLAAEAISQHPGVSHNYRRNHAYNLWYTLAVPPDSRLGLARTVEVLRQRSGARVMRLMPTMRLFKIGVKLDLGGDADLAARAETPVFTQEQQDEAMRFAVTDADKRMIRILQQDLPLVPRPFDAWAEQAGVALDDLLAAARTYQEQKRMRRFSAVLRHREAGFSANAMGVWSVPPGQQEQFGQAAASFSAVSHCYLRPTYEDWPYNVFTMVHAPTQEQCEAVLAAISAATGIVDYQALYSTREYKKVRVKYFLQDIETWERAALADSACIAAG